MSSQRKKNVIPSYRVKQLQGDVIYEIRCGTPDCPCGEPNIACHRGFFSLFIQAINGIAFAKRLNLRYYVNFGNIPYAYTQPGDPNPNFWDYYFAQSTRGFGYSPMLPNEMIETYPLAIWERSYFRSMAETMREELRYKPAVATMLTELNSKFKGHRVLGVHIRRTDHAITTEPVAIGDYIKQINKRISKFDKIFLATDDQEVATQFAQLYGDKLWLNDVVRSKNGQALHEDKDLANKYQLGLDALADCYALSLCTEALLYYSNLSYSVLFFNPELKYKLMERPSTKRRRLLTLALYYLDKWNIRKW
jgi:hypothetical protein